MDQETIVIHFWLNFEWPWAWALLALPLLMRFLPEAKTSLQDPAIRVPFYQALNELPDGNRLSDTGRRDRWLWPYIAWILLVAAIARPQWYGEPVALPTEARDLMLAVDVSLSMQETDMAIGGNRTDRLTAVKHVVGEFIQQRKSDRIGLILFGTQAYLQAPLTFDRQTVETLLNEARLGIAGRSTAIGDAIGLAIKQLKDRPSDSRVLILLTDGANRAGELDPIEAAQLAAEHDLKVHTVGVGADSRGFFSLRRGSELDERTLKAIADTTGGEYFRARNTESLERIYEYLDQLETHENEAQLFRPVKALFHWPLGSALLIGVIIALRRFSRSAIQP